MGGMFKTKRQRRQRRLRKLNDDDWSKLPQFLEPTVRVLWKPDLSEEEHARQAREDAETLDSITSDPEKRERLVIQWLNKAEKEADFANGLDRHIRIPTDSEDKECHEYWSTRRNKVYVWFAFIAFWISVVSLGISIFVVFYKE